MNRIKSLTEQIGAKQKEADAILAPARKENRAITGDENKKLEGIESSIAELRSTYDAEVRDMERTNARSKFKDLSQGEKRDVGRFDFSVATRAVMGEDLPSDGIEAEIAAEGLAEARKAGISGGGVFLPAWFCRRKDIITGRHNGDREARDVTATGGTSLNQGGFTIPTEKDGILDAFFAGLVMREAGATILTDLEGNFDVPRIVSGTAAAPAATENANGSEVSPTFTGPSFSPKRLSAYIDLSDQLLTQKRAMEAVLRRNLLEQHISKAESYSIEGLGSGGEPRGILNTTGIGSYAGGTNGALPSWAGIVALENKVAVQNALRGSCHYLTNFKVKGTMEVTAKTSADTASTMLYDADKNQGRLKGYMPLFTGNVSAARTKGSASAICSSLIFGQFVDSWLAFWGGVQLDMVRDKALAIAGMRTLVLNQFFDHNVVRPISFAAQKDVLTTPMN